MQAAPQLKTRGHLRRFLLLGALFEVFLILLAYFFPEGSPLTTVIHNFVLYVHIPLLTMLAGCESFVAGIFCLLMGLSLMVCLWAFIFFQISRFTAWLLANYVVSARQKWIAKCVVALVMVAIFIPLALYALPQTPRPFKNSPEVTSVVDSDNAFAIDLYQKLKDQPGNLFFSPYSISASLAMTYAGARGQTATGMARVLHFDSTQTDIHAAFGNLDKRMKGIQRWNRIALVTANSLWCQKNYSLSNTFMDLVQNNYDAEAKAVDFVHAPEAASSDINSWVERKTDGKIGNLTQPGQFTSYTRLVLCNAIYFKGKWQMQFNPDETRPAPFYVNSNETVTVPTMWQKANFKKKTSDDGSIELLEMPYIGNDLSMIIIMPAAKPEMADYEGWPDLLALEENLTAENLRSWLSELDAADAHKTDVCLPRFKTTRQFDLSEQLKSLGMALAFDDTGADFSGMDGKTNNLYISDVVHKAYVQVDEEGTEAAAATFEMVKTRGMDDRFIADHPFIFLIRDNATGAILFLGRMVDPTK